MSGTADVIHNARITLLATMLNNAALAFIVAGFIAPTVGGQLRGGPARTGNTGLGRAGRGATYRCAGCAREIAMTWDLALTWFIMPAVVALILGAGGLWLAKHTP
jgi:hypothetical protein